MEGTESEKEGACASRGGAAGVVYVFIGGQNHPGQTFVLSLPSSQVKQRIHAQERITADALGSSPEERRTAQQRGELQTKSGASSEAMAMTAVVPKQEWGMIIGGGGEGG